ncbi:MAG: DNA-binding transcriptional MerR regulator [Gammaproteobacteria bacterium]|jgi:DNA-binding transcriptional MerR regulator
MLELNRDNDRSGGYGIGELALEFCVTSRALRLYEEEKLLNPERVGTRRLYSERDRVRLRLILRGKRLGWSLAEIRESFELYDSSHGEEAQLELLLAKVEERRQLLETQKADIEKSLEDIERIFNNAQKALKIIRAE